MSNPVLYEVDGPLAIITLNRPERSNAINQKLLIGLYDALDDVKNNDAVRVAIITGAGNSFCSGIDLKAISTDNILNPRGDGQDLPDIIRAVGKPIIGAVNGHTMTGGLEIALQCDFLIASEKAFFADTHAKVNIHPGWGMSQLLQEAVGIRRAKQMSYGCQPVNAKTAYQWGLVNEVVTHDKLIHRAKQIAMDISEVNQQTLKVFEELIGFTREVSVNKAISLERKGFERKAMGTIFKK
jgi:enoyl-CoA hydratase